MRKLPQTAAEDLLEIIMRRDERASTLITSNRPVEDWGKLLGDTAAVAAFLDRLLHHAHVLTCGPQSWRTRLHGERGEARHELLLRERRAPQRLQDRRTEPCTARPSRPGSGRTASTPLRCARRAS
jgi:hypothetical protein